jgi:meso-butanediol dehydrogenase / (S,S)-butanediol dehydrogenase / diacetyl reductase
MELKDKVAIVTGAGGMIGQGICRSLYRLGMRVVAADLNTKACDALLAELGAGSDRAMSIQVSVTDKNSLAAMVQAVVARFGGIDALVNNAGVIELGSLVDLSEEKWDRVINVNLKGTFLCTQAVAPVMIAQNRGSIVNLASVAAKRPAPLQSAYAATKHGVVGLTQVWSQELAPHNITVNSVCPGFIDSPMWSQQLGPAYSAMVGVPPEQVMEALAKTQMPLGRPQTPSDIGDAVAFVCGAPNMTGQSLVIDGGFTRY